MMRNSKDQLDSKGLMKLVACEDDEEHVLWISTFQLPKIKMQGRHISKVLTIISHYYNKNGSIA